MYTAAIEQLRSENYNGFLALTLSHNGNQATTYAELFVTDDDTNMIVTPPEADLTSAYARWQVEQAIRDDEAEAQQLTKDDVKALLVAELIKITPNTPAAYAALQVIIGGNVRLTNAHQNTANLFGWDTGTQAGYLRAAYLLIALMS